MTHELKRIIEEAIKAKSVTKKAVLASVVDLDGSSYRRPGVRMLILEDGHMIGAVSGGCVENEVLLQAQSVFETGVSKMMTYDGRYRLGCEGVLYILLEQVNLSKQFKTYFFQYLNERKSFNVVSHYKKEQGVFKGLGTTVQLGNHVYAISDNMEQPNGMLVFRQHMPPCFKLVIIGAEHDAVQLCTYAALTGWEVTIVGGIKDIKSIKNFPGASTYVSILPEQLDVSLIDNETAVVLMTHNFAYDLRYLVALRHSTPNYIGLLGPTRRRDDLLAQFIEYCPEVSHNFLEAIHGPAGLDIGSETPQEIAIAIISEILAVTRTRSVIPLSKKSGAIHAKD